MSRLSVVLHHVGRKRQLQGSASEKPQSQTPPRAEGWRAYRRPLPRARARQRERTAVLPARNQQGSSRLLYLSHSVKRGVLVAAQLRAGGAPACRKAGRPP